MECGFPLGMYGVGGHFLGQADHLPVVEVVGVTEGWLALAAWTITFLAMVHHLVTTIGFGTWRYRERPVTDRS